MKPTFTFHICAAIAVSSLALGLTSCADEEIAQGGPLEGRIAFDPVLGNGGDRGSRSADDAATDVTSVHTTPLEGGDVEMFVHTVTTEGIERNDDPATDGEARSRAAVTNAANIQSFALFAYAYEHDPANKFDAIDRPNYIYNENISRSSGWQSTHFWPHGDKTLQFGAYSPFGSGNVTIIDGKTNDGDGGMITLKYVTPADLDKQEDLLVTRFMNVGEFRTIGSHVPLSEAKINLTFDHALAAIGIKAAPDMLEGKVTNVTMTDIIAEGTWELNRNTIDWTLDDSKLVTFSKDVNVKVGGGKEAVVIGGSDLFMVLPGSATRTSQLLITYTDDLSGTERTLKANLFPADLDESPYQPGKTYTYTISKNSIFVTPTLIANFENNFYFAGGTEDINVKSYAVISRQGDGVQMVDLPWTAEFSSDNGMSWSDKAPSWLTGFPTSGTGNHEAGETSSFTVARQSGVKLPNPHNDNLKNGPAMTIIEGDNEYSTEEPINDSGFIPYYNLMNDGNRYRNDESANCYIVRGPGRFTFTAYYGNARNTAVYNPDPYVHDPYSGEGMMLEEFLMHNGKKANQLEGLMTCGASDKISLKVLWSDAPNLLSDLSCDYVRNQYGGGQIACFFDVKRETIRQGNAVIGLFDADGQLRWSWHIWVTDPESIATTHQLGSTASEFMNVPLGWVGDRTQFAERSVKVRITQPYSGETKEYDLVQEGTEVTGYCPTFQFGRKDPMPAINFVTRSQVSVYNVQSGFRPSTVAAPAGYADRIVTGICRPSALLTGDATEKEDGTVEFDLLPYMNLWDNQVELFKLNMSSYTGKKTIYDPCPRGWSVPTAVQLKVLDFSSNDPDYFGRVFKHDPSNFSFFLPYVATRRGDGRIIADSEVSYLTSTGSTTGKVYAMTFDRRGVWPSIGYVWPGGSAGTFNVGHSVCSGNTYPVIPVRDVDSDTSLRNQ